MKPGIFHTGHLPQIGTSERIFNNDPTLWQCGFIYASHFARNTTCFKRKPINVPYKMVNTCVYIYEFECNHSFAQMQVACKIYKVWLPFLEDNKQKHVFKNKTPFKTRLVDILCHFTSSFLIENRVVWKIAYWLRENWQFQRNLLASCFWNDPWKRH